VSEEPPVQTGWIEPALAEELPGLGLIWCSFAATPAPSPPALVRRLRSLSDGFRGAQAIAMRTQAIPQAFRVLYRHIGLDPDTRRIPVEALALERLQRGGFPSRSLVDDALLVATMETGVGVWALDADRLRGELGLGTAGGKLVVADAAGPVAELFGAPGEQHGVTWDTRQLALYAVLAPGVPRIAGEEALWSAWETMSG
jgi:DNA/RNA-binding domain of Phe-tRNA-synthetase-like protein